MTYTLYLYYISNDNDYEHTSKQILITADEIPNYCSNAEKLLESNYGSYDGTASIQQFIVTLTSHYNCSSPYIL